MTEDSGRTVPSTDDLVGSQFGDYLMMRRLGSGGMADVYLAVQQSLDRQVAIKILKAELAADDSYVRRFHNEAKSVAALVHPNIAQVHEVGQVSRQHFIAQEYVAGRNLKQQLTRTPSLEVEEAIRITRAVAAALAKAASQGIIHRDIKPENILLSDDGEVKVVDFGLAHKGRDHRQLELTQIGMTVGTPLYMSPEQIRGGAVTSQADMYSLGVTAYHMIAGYPPFDADTPLNVAMKHVNEEAPPLTVARPEVPPPLASIVARMMQKRPEDRFAGFEQLIEQLDKVTPHAHPTGHSGMHRPATQPLLAATRDLAAAIGGTATSGTMRAARQRRLAGWALIALALGAILGFAAAPSNPLAKRAGEQLPAIERKETARAQFAYAMLMNSQEAWQSVFTYYPADGEDGGERQRYYALLAKRNLAQWYLENDRASEAQPLLEELAALDSTQTQLVAFGLAGQAIVAYRAGDMQRAASMLASVEVYRDIIDPSLRDELIRIRRQFQRN